MILPRCSSFIFMNCFSFKSIFVSCVQNDFAQLLIKIIEEKCDNDINNFGLLNNFDADLIQRDIFRFRVLNIIFKRSSLVIYFYPN